MGLNLFRDGCLLTLWVCTIALLGQTPAAEESWRLPSVDDGAVATAAAESPYFAPLGQPPGIAELADEAGFDGGPLFVPPNRFTATWLASGGSQGFGTFDLDYNRTWYLQ